MAAHHTTAQTLGESRSELQYRYLRVAFPILFVFYGVLAVAHLAVLDGWFRTTMVGVAATTAAISGALTALRDQPFLRQQVTPATVLFIVLVGANSYAHLIVTGDAFQSTNLLLMVVGASVLVVSAELFFATVTATLAAFAIAVAVHPDDPLWPHFGFALLAALTMASVMFFGNRAAHNARFEAEHERQKTIDQLAESEERYRALVRHAPAPMIVHRDGIVLYVNLAASRLIGAGDDSVLGGTRFYDLFPPDDADRVAAWYNAAIAGELGDQTTEAQLRALHGDWPIVELAAAKIRWQGKPAGMLVATDVTFRRALQDTIATSMTPGPTPI